MAYYVAPPSIGLGDVIVTLPVVQSLIERGEKVWLVVRNSAHLGFADCIDGLTGCCLVGDLDSVGIEKQHDIFLDLRDHDLQRKYWWGGTEFERDYPGITINEILKLVLAAKGIEYVDFENLKPIRFRRRIELNDTVVLVPGTTLSAKIWSFDNWLALGTVLSALGVPSVIVGQPEKSLVVRRLIEAGLPWIKTPSLSDALDVISSSKAVVSVDTGLMHLAVQQGIPAVGLYRPYPVYRRLQKHFVCLLPTFPCNADCFQREREFANASVTLLKSAFKPIDWDCTQTKDRCLDSISVDAVIDALTGLGVVVSQKSEFA